MPRRKSPRESAALAYHHAANAVGCPVVRLLAVTTNGETVAVPRPDPPAAALPPIPTAILTVLAADPSRGLKSAAIVARTRRPASNVRDWLARLVEAGRVEKLPGRGGYRLARPAPPCPPRSPAPPNLFSRFDPPAG